MAFAGGIEPRMDATRGRAGNGSWWQLSGASDRRQARRDILVLLLSLSGLAGLALASPFREVGLEWLFLILLALIADWMPISLGEGLRLRFVAPFLVAVAVTMGPVAAVITDVTALVAAMFGMRLVADGSAHSAARELVRSLAISVLAAGAYWLVVKGDPSAPLMLMAGGTVLVLVHTGAHVLFPLEGRRWKIHPLAEMRPSISLVAIYVLLAVAAAVLAMSGSVAGCLLLFGPILALRRYLEVKLRMQAASYQAVTTLAMMLQHAHPYTHRHLERVASFSEEVALRLGLDRARALRVHRAAVLHDIGKIAVDEDILDLPRKLTTEEFAHVQLHAEFGGQILEPVDEFREESRWIRYHHERPDGRGYPEGLLDPEIPIESKIIAVVDAFDAMTGGMEGRDGRPFKEPMSVEAALAELDRCAGTQFDYRVVTAFRAVVEGGR